MNVRRDRKSESSESDSRGCVRRCDTRRVTQAKVFVTDMNRESHSGDQEAQSVPGDTHRIGSRPTGERSECDVDDKVHHTYDYHRPQPPLMSKCIHACGPTPDLRCAREPPSSMIFRENDEKHSIGRPCRMVSVGC